MNTKSTTHPESPAPPRISIATAAEWTANWRKAEPGKTLSQCFTLAEINDVVTSAGSAAVGVRAYYGLEKETATENFKMKLFLVAVDTNGNDILPTSGVIVDFARPCPSYCGVTNILNSGLAG